MTAESSARLRSRRLDLLAGRGGGGGAFGFGLLASMPSVILTASLTVTPPASMARFHFRPQSLRLTVVVAVAPTTKLRPALTGPVGPSTSSVTSLVTPCIVRSPTSLNLPAAPGTTRFDLKVSVGYLATSKKSGLFRWVSRRSLLVVMVVASMVTSAAIVDDVLAVVGDLARHLAERARARSTPSGGVTVKPAVECAGSMFHSLGPSTGCGGGPCVARGGGGVGAGAWA